MHTEALGSNWRSADDLVLGAENLLFPPSAIALGPPTQEAYFHLRIKINPD